MPQNFEPSSSNFPEKKNSFQEPSWGIKNCKTLERSPCTSVPGTLPLRLKLDGTISLQPVSPRLFIKFDTTGNGTKFLDTIRSFGK